MGKKTVAAITLLVVLGAGAFCVWWYHSLPQYSLMQVRKAVEQHDAAEFEKYVDLEGIIRRAGNQLSSQWSGSFAKELGSFGGIEPDTVNGMISAFGSAMIESTVKQVRESVLSFIETGRATPIQSIPGDALDIASDLRIDSMPTVETKGKIATVDINLLAQGEPVKIRLFMRNVGSHWQIAEIDETTKTAQAILAAYAQGERKRIESEQGAHPDRVIKLPGLAEGAKELVLAYIPSGKFMMGSPPNEANRGEGETRHRVQITKPFRMGKYEVTNAQFEAFVKATGYVTEAEKEGDKDSWRNPEMPEKTGDSEGPWKDLPVVMVTHNDASAFVKWLSETSGETLTLPSEAQWEYACRAGGTSAYFWGDSEEGACRFANVFDQTSKATLGGDDAIRCADGYVWRAPVGSFEVNGFGLHDTTGNVWEWCADWYDRDYYASSPQEDPTGPQTGSWRVYRGGSWIMGPQRCRSAFRDWNKPAYRFYFLGFRLAASSAVR